MKHALKSLWTSEIATPLKAPLAEAHSDVLNDYPKEEEERDRYHKNSRISFKSIYPIK